MPGRFACLFVMLLALSACQVNALPGPPAVSTVQVQGSPTGTFLTPATLTLVPTLTRIPAPLTPTTTTTTEESNFRVEIAIFDTNGRTAVSAAVGSQVELTIAFRPYKDVITTRADGTQNRYSTDWNPNTVAEMRYCVGPSRLCALPDPWMPFASRQRVNVPVEWVGLRDFGVTAQFRDASGKIIPAGLTLTDIASNWVPVTGVIDERTPVAAQPPAIQTAVAQAQAAFPVMGSLKVGDQPRMGGKAGTSVTIPAYFQATSPLAPVTEMRIKRDVGGRCLTPEEMSDAAWEPFAASKTYQTSIAINFTTFKLHVQYRDAKGNVSQVYCGEVVLEGGP